MSVAADADALYCAELLRRDAFEAYAATLFVPPSARRGLIALHAFALEVGRVGDQVSQPLAGEIRLQWWRDLILGEEHGGPAGSPVAAELRKAIQRHGLDVDALAGFIDAHRGDLHSEPIADDAALAARCDDTFGALFAAAALIVGGRPAPDALVTCAGRATGVVDLICDLPRRAARRQAALPLTLMEKRAHQEDAVFAEQDTPALREALAEMLNRASVLAREARRLLLDAEPAARPAFLPLALAERDAIRLRSAQPFQRADRSHLATLWTLWRASRQRSFR